MLSNDALRPTFNAISHEQVSHIITNRVLYIVYHTYPHQNIRFHRIDTILRNKNCLHVRGLHNLRPWDVFNARYFVPTVTWECVMTVMNAKLAKLFYTYRKKVSTPTAVEYLFTCQCPVMCYVHFVTVVSCHISPLSLRYVTSTASVLFLVASGARLDTSHFILFVNKKRQPITFFLMDPVLFPRN
jgi:hypothetical protein